MARTDHLEREFKLGADLDFALPDLRPIVGGTVRLPEQILRTTYFDTADLRLWGRGITLRHRVGEEGNGGLWTLKVPEETTGPALERAELSWSGSREHLPDEPLALLKGVIRRAVLGEAVELESIRKRLRLGSSLGEIDDDVVTVKSGARKGYVFRQIELEFELGQSPEKSDVDTIDAVLSQIRRAGAHADGQQKFAKALDLTAATPPEPAGRHLATIRSAVELSIRNAFHQILDHDVLLRLQADEPPKRSIHQARVATRRLRSDLKTFRILLDPVWLKHTTTELKWLGMVLGQVRDIDVLDERLAAWSADKQAEKEGRTALAAGLHRQRQLANGELAQALNSDRYVELLERLATAASQPPLTRTNQGSKVAAEVFPSLVQHQYKSLRRRVKKGGRHPDDAQLHRIRIGAKQLRYAAEVATPFVGKSARRTGKQAEDLQTVLGEHHDAVAAEAWLRQALEEASALGAFAAGRLVAETRHQKSKSAKRWKGIWGDIRGDVRWLYR